MTAFLLAALGIIVSACTRLNAVVFGQPVSVPWLGIVAVLMGLGLLAAVLWIARNLLRDGLRLRPGTVT